MVGLQCEAYKDQFLTACDTCDCQAYTKCGQDLKLANIIKAGFKPMATCITYTTLKLMTKIQSQFINLNVTLSHSCSVDTQLHLHVM